MQALFTSVQVIFASRYDMSLVWLGQSHYNLAVAGGQGSRFALGGDAPAGCSLRAGCAGCE